MPNRVKPIPEGYNTVTPILVTNDVVRELEFCKKAFGARELSRFEAPTGGCMHAELQIGSSRVMLGSECQESKRLAPSSTQSNCCTMYLYVEDVDAAFDQAIKAGGKVATPVADTFWGDRMGELTDPSGHRWSLATHKLDLTHDQIAERAEEFFASLSKT